MKRIIGFLVIALALPLLMVGCGKDEINDFHLTSFDALKLEFKTEDAIVSPTTVITYEGTDLNDQISNSSSPFSLLQTKYEPMLDYALSLTYKGYSVYFQHKPLLDEDGMKQSEELFEEFNQTFEEFKTAKTSFLTAKSEFEQKCSTITVSEIGKIGDVELRALADFEKQYSKFIESALQLNSRYKAIIDHSYTGSYNKWEDVTKKNIVNVVNSLVVEARTTMIEDYFNYTFKLYDGIYNPFVDSIYQANAINILNSNLFTDASLESFKSNDDKFNDLKNEFIVYYSMRSDYYNERNNIGQLFSEVDFDMGILLGTTDTSVLPNNLENQQKLIRYDKFNRFVSASSFAFSSVYQNLYAKLIA